MKKLLLTFVQVSAFASIVALPMSVNAGLDDLLTQPGTICDPMLGTDGLQFSRDAGILTNTSSERKEVMCPVQMYHFYSNGYALPIEVRVGIENQSNGDYASCTLRVRDHRQNEVAKQNKTTTSRNGVQALDFAFPGKSVWGWSYAYVWCRLPAYSSVVYVAASPAD